MPLTTLEPTSLQDFQGLQSLAPESPSTGSTRSKQSGVAPSDSHESWTSQSQSDAGEISKDPKLDVDAAFKIYNYYLSPRGNHWLSDWRTHDAAMANMKVAGSAIAQYIQLQKLHTTSLGLKAAADGGKRIMQDLHDVLPKIPRGDVNASQRYSAAMQALQSGDIEGASRYASELVRDFLPQDDLGTIKTQEYEGSDGVTKKVVLQKTKTGWRELQADKSGTPKEFAQDMTALAKLKADPDSDPELIQFYENRVRRLSETSEDKVKSKIAEAKGKGEVTKEVNKAKIQETFDANRKMLVERAQQKGADIAEKAIVSRFDTMFKAAVKSGDVVKQNQVATAQTAFLNATMPEPESKPAASAPTNRVRVTGPNGEKGTVVEGEKLPQGWSLE